MDQEERGKYYRYLEREFEERADDCIYFFLSQDIQDAKAQGRKTIMDYLFEERYDFYMTLFTEIYIRDRGYYPLLIKLWPYLKLKAILDNLRDRIPQTEGRKKVRLLDLHQHYYNYLVNATLLIKLKSGKKVMTEEHLRPLLPSHVKNIDDDLVRAAEENYLELIPGIIGEIPPDVDPDRLCIDNDYILISRDFLESQGRNTLRNFENILLGKPVEDYFDGIEYQYRHGVKEVKENPWEIPGFLMYYINMVKMLLSRMEFDRAEQLVDLLIEDFRDQSAVERQYLEVKLRNRKVDDVRTYIENKYKPEEIEKDPYLLMCLSECEQEAGNIPEAVNQIKRAYETSGRKFFYMVEYSKVLLLKDWNEAGKLIRDHISNDGGIGDDISKEGLMFLIRQFFWRDLSFTKELLDQYAKHFPAEDVKNRGLYHIEYLNLLYKYHIQMGDLKSAEGVLEQLVKDYPQWETGYRRFAEFYSTKDNKDVFDMEKSLQYARKCAEIRGIPSGYYTGISYANAGEWKKAVEKFSSFIKEIDNVPPTYSRVYMHMFKAYMEIGNKKKACEMAGHYLDIYDQPLYLELYKSPAVDTISLLQNDIVFFELIAKACRRHSKRARALLKERKLWLGNIGRSLENEKLMHEIEELKKKNQEIREKYEKLNLGDEKVLERFLNELENNEIAHSRLLKQINTKIWENANKSCKNNIVGFEKLPEDVQDFIQTGEFMLQFTDLDADFSAVILSFTKAFEKILDDEVGLKFTSQIGEIKGQKRYKISDDTVRKLFPSKYVKHHSITPGKWVKLIEKQMKGGFESDDRISQKFSEFIKEKFGEHMSTIKKYSSILSEVRNSCAHTEKISKAIVDNNIEILREAICTISKIFC